MKRSELDALKASITATKAVRTRAEAAVASLKANALYKYLPTWAKTLIEGILGA
jgi:hypothetical protein